MNFTEQQIQKQKQEQKFAEEYERLNPQQKEAVDTIEGPVLVIAGPGTGKTQILAARIANILQAGVDAKPQNILCLTYTDAGAIAMRKRLMDFIGPTAHKVNIYTFHAFCNDVIQHHPQFFLKRDSEPISDLESAEIYHKLLDELPQGHPLRKLRGDLYSDVRRLKTLFDVMKKEDWTAEFIEQQANQYIAQLPFKEEYIYKTNGKTWKKGDLKQKHIDAETEKLEDLKAGAALFEKFDAKMKARARYDFNDMILWVLKAFRENSFLLSEYQERFQYVLVDEFQDTSGSQKELLEMLIDYWGMQANVFVVGDDDQGIYEFQGARINNIKEFYDRFQGHIKLLMLTENYRSTQPILDAAKASIDYNTQRLIHLIQEFNLDKTLVASNPEILKETPTKPRLVEYINVLHEEADIVQQIETLRQSGQNMAEVAVLYAQHKQAENIIRLMEKKNIPYTVRKSMNLLSLPMVVYFISMLRYLQRESQKSFSGEDLIFKLLHYPGLQISPIDLAQLSLHLSQKPRTEKNYWRILLNNPLEIASLNLTTTKAINQFGGSMNKWLHEMQQLTLPMLFEDIIYESGIISHILKSPNRVWEMQVLNTFFNFIKEESTKNPRMHIDGFLTMLDEMAAEKLELPITKVVAQEKGVNFITTHSAKGLEFDHVFIMGCTKDFWEDKKGATNQFKLPDTLVGDQKTNSEEATRRLFYVAMTRAKKHLQISYATRDTKDKPKQASQYVSEVQHVCVQEKIAVSEDAVMEQIRWAFEPDPEINIEVAKKEFLDQRLKSFSLSPSSLNKYLNCPVAFYYETVLQVPSAPNDTLAFGNAVHYALEMLFKDMLTTSDKSFPSCDALLKYFEKGMKRQEECFTEKQYPRRMELGQKVLTEYYQHNVGSWPKTVALEKMITNVNLDEVPIKGKMDRIDFEGNNCVVYDYKTGGAKYSLKDKLTPPSDETPLGGDYWRQMIFYKILIDNYPFNDWKMHEGVFDFIEKNEEKNAFVRHKIICTADDVKTVKQQIKSTYQKIMNHEFSKGCNDENCQWCQFVKTYEVNRKPNVGEEMVTIDE